jgi:hypothetical protein
MQVGAEMEINEVDSERELLIDGVREEIKKRSHGMSVVATRRIDDGIRIISLGCDAHNTKIDIIVDIDNMSIEVWSQRWTMLQYSMADPKCFDGIEDAIKTKHQETLQSCGSAQELRFDSILPERLYDFLGFYGYRRKFETVSKDRLMHVFSTMSKIDGIRYMEASAGTFFITWEDGRNTVHRPDQDNWPNGISNEEWHKSWMGH